MSKTPATHRTQIRVSNIKMSFDEARSHLNIISHIHDGIVYFPTNRIKKAPKSLMMITDDH